MNQIGTTKRGIGPTYGTKATRDGLRVIDMYHESFDEKLRLLAQGYRKRYGDLLKYDVKEELARFREYRERLRPYIVDAVEYMSAAREKSSSVLVEGSQALSMFPLTNGAGKDQPRRTSVLLTQLCSAGSGLWQLPVCDVFILLNGWLHPRPLVEPFYHQVSLVMPTPLRSFETNLC